MQNKNLIAAQINLSIAGNALNNAAQALAKVDSVAFKKSIDEINEHALDCYVAADQLQKYLELQSAKKKD